MSFVFGTCHVSLCDDGVYHSMLVHVIVELLISCYFDADKLFVGCVGNLISMLVEDLYDTVPFVTVLFWTKPAKVITVCYDYHCLLCFGPFEEELEVPWSVLVTSFFKAFVEIY
jgi:hypothetical protein